MFLNRTMENVLMMEDNGEDDVVSDSTGDRIDDILKRLECEQHRVIFDLFRIP